MPQTMVEFHFPHTGKKDEKPNRFRKVKSRDWKGMIVPRECIFFVFFDVSSGERKNESDRHFVNVPEPLTKEKYAEVYTPEEAEAKWEAYRLSTSDRMIVDRQGGLHPHPEGETITPIRTRRGRFKHRKSTYYDRRYYRRSSL